MNASTTRPITTRSQGIFLVILATVFWGTSGIFINLIIQKSGISPLGLAFLRDCFTFLIILIAIAVSNQKLLAIKRRDIFWFIAMGASIGALHVFWNMSIMLVGASIATVIQSNSPIFVTFMAWIFFKEPLTKVKFAALALSITGTIMISGLHGLGSLQITAYGLLIALTSAITNGLMSLFGKKLVGTYSPWTALLYTFGIASLLLRPLQVNLPLPRHFTGELLMLFTGLVLVSTVSGYVLFTTALKTLDASIASITNTAEVAFAAILAYFILGERLDAWQIFGALLIVSGVILISLPNGKNNRTPRHG
jgi:DME family drug/metabolite transporter